MDGARQREALTAAGRTIDHLGAEDWEAAIAAAHRAEELDQVGLYEGFSAAVARVVDDRSDGEAWQALADSVEPGPLREQIAGVRP